MTASHRSRYAVARPASWRIGATAAIALTASNSLESREHVLPGSSVVERAARGQGQPLGESQGCYWVNCGKPSVCCHHADPQPSPEITRGRFRDYAPGA